MITELFAKLKPYGQEHLLAFWEMLDEKGRAHLAHQINELDLPCLASLIPEYVLQKPQQMIPSDLTPPPYFPAVPTDALRARYAEAEAAGAALLRAGKVAILTVAGGQGTRLGFEGPKGTYPITPVAHKSFFQYNAETILRLNEKYGTTFTWYIMTSELNDQITRDFFASHNHFGLHPDKIVFFAQGTMPVISSEGKLLLENPSSLVLAPDGHGGTLLALRRKGCLDRMVREGTEYLSYFQIDNPLVTLADPLFIGLHHLEQSEMSARMLPKVGPFEKLGNFCMSNGRLTIIEYSDMPADLAEARNPDGSLKFICGSPAIHILSRSFIERLTADGRLNLPWHRADKKVPFINSQGDRVKPEENNAVKLESFIFDAVPMASRTLILEAAREDEFAPTKNATGVDSVESCRQMLSDRDARWLRAAGVSVPADAVVELTPRWCVDAADAADYVRREKISDLLPGEEKYFN